jgi:hypothetical protein
MPNQCKIAKLALLMLCMSPVMAVGIMGLINQKNGLFHDLSETLVVRGL